MTTRVIGARAEMEHAFDAQRTISQLQCTAAVRSGVHDGDEAFEENAARERPVTIAFNTRAAFWRLRERRKSACAV